MSNKGPIKNLLTQDLGSPRGQVAEFKVPQAVAEREPEQVTEKTGQKEIEELRRQCEELRKQDASKDAFLSTVAHEIRTPLTSILSFTEILMRYPDESAKTRFEFYSIIMQESRRLTRLVNHVLDLSKIKAGRMQWHFKKLSIRKTIRQCIRTMRTLLEEKEIHLTCLIEERLPVLRADEDRLLQVLENLLNNAIKFTPKGGQIHFTAERMKGKRSGDPKNLVHVSIRDSGIGIKEDDLIDIFSEFKQCKDTLREVKGTGLGLSICKEIVACHRGNIWMESTYGRGTTVHVTLPAWNAGTSGWKEKKRNKRPSAGEISTPK